MGEAGFEKKKKARRSLVLAGSSKVSSGQSFLSGHSSEDRELQDQRRFGVILLLLCVAVGVSSGVVGAGMHYVVDTIQAAFNAPIAGVTFVFEEVLDVFSRRAIGGLCLVTGFATIVSRSILQSGATEGYFSESGGAGRYKSSLWMFFCIPIGILAGALGFLLVKWIIVVRRKLRTIGVKGPNVLLLAGCGLLVGALGIVAFEVTDVWTVWGGGEAFVKMMLNGDEATDKLSWWPLIVVLLCKFTAVVLSVGARAPGGMFVPTLVIGGVVGSCLSPLCQLMVNAVGYENESVQIPCIVFGMGAMFAAVFRSPVSAMLLIYEMTREYSLILPLMAGNVVAQLVSSRLSEESFYDLVSKIDGQNFRVNQLIVEQMAAAVTTEPRKSFFTPRVCGMDADEEGARASLAATWGVRSSELPVRKSGKTEAFQRQVRRHSEPFGPARPTSPELPAGLGLSLDPQLQTNHKNAAVVPHLRAKALSIANKVRSANIDTRNFWMPPGAAVVAATPDPPPLIPRFISEPSIVYSESWSRWRVWASEQSPHAADEPHAAGHLRNVFRLRTVKVHTPALQDDSDLKHHTLEQSTVDRKRGHGRSQTRPPINLPINLDVVQNIREGGNGRISPDGHNRIYRRHQTYSPATTSVSEAPTYLSPPRDPLVRFQAPGSDPDAFDIPAITPPRTVYVHAFPFASIVDVPPIFPDFMEETSPTARPAFMPQLPQ